MTIAVDRTFPVIAGRRVRATATHVRLSLREARPVVQCAFAVRFLSGAALSRQLVRSRLLHLLATATVWECVVVFVYLYNGVADTVEDRANGADKPIASGELPVAFAARLAAGFAGAALAGSLVLAHLLVVPVLLMMLLGYAYSSRHIQAKSRPVPAFLVVTAGGLLTYYAGAAASGPRVPPLSALVLAGAMSLWMGVVGTTAKDLSDVTGDRAAGRRSLAVVFGPVLARRVLAAGALLVGAGFLAAALVAGERAVVLAALVVLSGAVLVAVSALREAEVHDRWRQRRPYRFFMATQLVAHVVVVLAMV